jgi:hypothetical protein
VKCTVFTPKGERTFNPCSPPGAQALPYLGKSTRFKTDLCFFTQR